MQRALWDPVDPTLLGSLSPGLRARVNGEIYRFANGVTLGRFRAAPALYCGLLRDPVSGARFWPSMRSPHCQWDGGPYFFTSSAHRDTFLSQPARFEVKRVM